VTHWTEELFRENPALFYDSFEHRMENTPDEVEALLCHLRECGFAAGRILDMNCGIGRHSVEIARRGISVIGTDISPRYIGIAGERAREAGVSDNVLFRIADMRAIGAALAAERPLDGVICLWTSFGFYDDDTNEDILRQCRELVRPGGFFALDIVNRDWLVKNFVQRGFARTANYVILEERMFDAAKSRNHMKWTYLRKAGENAFELERTVDVDHRVWSPHELVGLLEKTGWECEKLFPGFVRGFIWKGLSPPPAPEDALESPMILYVGRRPADV